MTESNWVAGPPPATPPAPVPTRSRRGRAGMAALGAVGGVVAGAAIAWGVGGANAATASTATPVSPRLSNASSAVRPDFPRPGGDLNTSGTVTAVGASSVTIRTSSGTKTYKVSSSSDIDKNGEAQLSDLAAGDAVRFDTDTVNGTPVIDHLHAGNEALDRPTH